MKQIAVFCIALMLISCGASKTVRDSKKVIKGEWTLNTISYSQSGTFNVTLLDDVSKACFQASKWQFVPNNNTGIYNIQNTNCATGVRHFVFTIQEIDPETGLYDFLLKPTDSKHKSETNKGFRLQLKELSDTTMQWQQSVSVNGEPFIISMNFIKTQ